MKTQTEAERLAHALEMGRAMVPELDLPEAAAELRRLHEREAKLMAEVEATERQVNILSDALAESRKINAELLEALRLIRDVSGGAAVAIAKAAIAKHSKEQ